MKKVFWVVLAVLLLSGCIGVESHIVLNNDGSGTIRLRYTIDRVVQEMSGAESPVSALPLPVTREDFQRTVAGIEGLDLLRYRYGSDEQGATVEAELRFTRFGALQRLIGREEGAVALEVRDGTHIFRQLLFAPRGEASPEAVDLIESLMGGAGITITVEVPDSVRSASLGEVASGGKRVVFQSTVAELVKERNQKVLEVVW